MARLSLREKVKSSTIQEELGVEPLPLHNEGTVLRARPTNRTPPGGLTSFSPAKRLNILAGEKEVWVFLLRLLLPLPDPGYTALDIHLCD